MGKKRGNGEGSIIKIKDNFWRGAVVTGRDENGNMKRKWFNGKTKKEVMDKMQPVLALINTGEYIEPSKTLLGDWLDVWLSEYKKNVLKPTTYDSYETNIRCHLKPGLGYISLKDLKTFDIQKFINNKFESGVSTALIRKLKNILHGALKQAITNQLVKKNVSEGVVLPTHVQKEIRVFTKLEVEAFIDELKGDRLEVAFKLDLVSGLRVGELLGLTWDCVDIEQGILSIRQSLIRVKNRKKNTDSEKKNLYIIENTTKTKNSNRKVAIPKTAVAMLERYKLLQEWEMKKNEGVYVDHNLLFCTALGNRMIPKNAARTFKRVSEKAGIIGATIHSIRHTYATRLFEKGVAPKTVSELLGHKNVSHTLDVYTHVLPDVKSDAVENLNYILM
jgi:integrase